MAQPIARVLCTAGNVSTKAIGREANYPNVEDHYVS